MPRQRNSSQNKGQEVKARQLNKTDISNMPESEFKTTIIRILAGLEKSIEETRELLATDIQDPNTCQNKI